MPRKYHRHQQRPLFENEDVQTIRKRIKSKMPKLIRRDGSPTCCDRCDQNGEYILNGTIVCKDCGNQSIQLWNEIIKGE